MDIVTQILNAFADGAIWVLNILNDNAAAVTALATVAIAALTFKLAIENKKLRKAGSEPKIAAYLAPHPHGVGAVNFILANIGQGPALNVKFLLEYDEDDFTNHNVLIQNSPERSALTIIPQGEKITILFGISHILYGKNNPKSDQILKPFKVIITYEDLSGELRIATQELDILQYHGLAGLQTEPADVKIAQSLKKIEQHISKVSRLVGPITNFLNTSTIADPVTQKTPGNNVQKDDENDTSK